MSHLEKEIVFIYQFVFNAEVLLELSLFFSFITCTMTFFFNYFSENFLFKSHYSLKNPLNLKVIKEFLTLIPHCLNGVLPNWVNQMLLD